MSRIALVLLLVALMLSLAGLATPSSSGEPGAPTPSASPPSVVEPTVVEPTAAATSTAEPPPTPEPPPVLIAPPGNEMVGLQQRVREAEPMRSEFLERLSRVKPGLNYLVGAMPGGKVSHKNGFFPAEDGTWVDNDAGIVRVATSSGGYAFAYTFLSEGVEVKYDDIWLAQQIGRMAWDFFEARYRG